MRRMSIWPILVELIICLTVLCGCHAEGSVSTPSPDSSRSPYLSELYLLKYDEVMAFDMNLLPPAGHRYFKNGDSKETVYSALEQYVNEVKEEKNHDE